jgi:predicted Zn-dependent peptidase
MQSLALFDRPDDYYEGLVERYEAQTTESLDTAARTALALDEFVWIVVGDADQVRPQLEALGMPLEVRPMEDGEQAGG